MLGDRGLCSVAASCCQMANCGPNTNLFRFQSAAAAKRNSVREREGEILLSLPPHLFWYLEDKGEKRSLATNVIVLWKWDQGRKACFFFPFYVWKRKKKTESGITVSPWFINSINTAQVHVLKTLFPFVQDDPCFVSLQAGAKLILVVFHRLCPALNQDIWLSHI